MHDCSKPLGSVRLSTMDERGFHVAPNMRAKQMLMVFDQVQSPRLLLGREALWLQGFPIESEHVAGRLHEDTEDFLCEVAANMLSLPVLLAVFMASVSSLSWRVTEASVTELGASDLEAHENAKNSFALCAGSSDRSASEIVQGGGFLKRFRSARSQS